jgi:uncharacterized protein (DUF983 family)
LELLEPQNPDLCTLNNMSEISNKKINRGYLPTVLTCRCPRCREGKLFKHPLNLRFSNILLMNETCPVCGQPTEIEVGFYYGTSFVSYGLTVLLSAGTFIAWWIFIGLSTEDNRFIFWLIFNAALLIILQPWLMRFSRSLWISWFVKYDPDWKLHKPGDVSERMNQEQGSNW